MRFSAFSFANGIEVERRQIKSVALVYGRFCLILCGSVTCSLLKCSLNA